jgi:hypothetical protein
MGNTGARLPLAWLYGPPFPDMRFRHNVHWMKCMVVANSACCLRLYIHAIFAEKLVGLHDLAISIPFSVVSGGDRGKQPLHLMGSFDLEKT